MPRLCADETGQKQCQSDSYRVLSNSLALLRPSDVLVEVGNHVTVLLSAINGSYVMWTLPRSCSDINRVIDASR